MITTSGEKSLVASALWRRRRLIAVATVLGAVLGYLLSSLQDETYQAESRLVLSATHPFDPLGGTAGNASRYLANQREVIQSGEVLDLAAAELGAGDDTELLEESLAVTTLADSDIIIVTAQAPTAELAAARANAVAFAYQQFISERVDEIADAAALVVAGGAAAVAGIRTEAAVYGDGVSVVERASVPVEPIAPKPVRDALLLGILSAIVASGFALWRRDHQARTPQELAADADAALLGVVDVPVARGRVTATAPEGYDMAVVGLDYTCDGRSPIVMVSPLGRHPLARGVALGLAAAAARTRRVLVVDADGDGAPLIAAAQVDPPPQTLDEAGDAGSLDRFVVDAPLPGDDGVRVDLAVLTRDAAGPQGAARRRLASLAGAYDLVLVCAGPVSEDPVAFALLRDVGEVVLVVDGQGRGARTQDLVDVRDRLSLAGRACSGVVVASARRSRARLRHQPPLRSSPDAVPDAPVHTR
ncbi:Wzz/FepE/Etk N-terminal domain-containing protein [Blastococcus saxobsidens]|uniref:Putative Lipopolysaccharide biosynthesis protein n=1 Tax=Blastococcus saxobsidens (strain DD2) TaxID=1146883 RepID=H6RN29_BLASD|nr:Wzz/FepE/Etk N-terminal domain-containing protein [Blastococcus saxobsidens]CCG01382.1 putative Lipopolysaccharide biosynthesis protein [Blastococcus saxobsidens DD2]